MTDRELLKQALEAFESGRAADRADVMTALRAALQRPEKQLKQDLKNDSPT
jgi:hypothetical protein